MFRKIISSPSFPYIVRGFEAVAIALILLGSILNPDFGFIEAALLSGGMFMIIEFIYWQKSSVDGMKAVERERDETRREIKDIKSHFDTRLELLEERLMSVNEIHRALEFCDIESAHTRELFGTYSDISEERHELFHRIAVHQLDALSASLRKLKEGCYDYSRGDRCAFGRVGINLVNERLDCVSSFDGVIGRFWTSEASSVYTAAMEAAINRGVRIRRIFYYHRNLSQEYLEVIEKQRSIGVKVLLLDTRIPGNKPDEELCFLIGDNQIVANTVFSQCGEILKWEIFDKTAKRREFVNSFQKLLRKSRDAGDVLKNPPKLVA